MSDRTVNAGVVGAFDCVSAWIKSGDRESSKTGVLVRLHSAKGLIDAESTARRSDQRVLSRSPHPGGEEWREQHQVIQLNHISSFETRLKSKALVLLLVRSLLHLAQFGNRILK